MAANKNVVTGGARDDVIGAAGEGLASRVVIQITAIGAGALTVKGRVIGSGGAYQAIGVTNAVTGAIGATAAAVGIFYADCGGLEIQLSFSVNTTYSYQFISS